MKCKKHLTERQRWDVIHTWQQLRSISATAKSLGISYQTAFHWISRFRKTGAVTPRKSTGRPRILSGKNARVALKLMLSEQHGGTEATAKELYARNITPKKVHAVTVRRSAARAAKQQGKPIKYSRGRPRSALSDETKLKRWNFATAHLRDTWANVLITDRKRFYFRYPGSRVKLARWIRKGERVEARVMSNPQCLNVYLGISKYGVTGCHVVAGSSKHKSPYSTKKGQPARNITAAEYRNVLMSTLLPGGARIMACQGFSSWVFQQDNDPCHKDASSVIKEWSKRRGSNISLLPWPPSSPDLSPIENVWARVQGEVDALGCKTFEEYTQAIKEHIRNLPKSYLKSLFDSMKSRLEEVIRRKGGKTDY